MVTWKKRLMVGLESLILFIYLDGCLLIFIRSIDGNGIYQTVTMKWTSFLYWTFGLIFLICCQLAGIILWKKSYEK